MAFKKATKQQSKGRMAIDGPSGSGKTFTALRVAKALAPTGRIAVIDTERGSASKYADLFEFDVQELDSFHPDSYVKAIREAEEAGYEVLVIDSLSHAWEGEGGVLELTDNAAARSRSGNKFAAWRETTPLHNKLVNTMIQCSCHLVTTMRTKTEWVIEEDDRGKKVPRRVGMQPVQRAGMEYEFDVVLDMDHEHKAVVSKSRCPALADQVFRLPGEDDLGRTFRDWLTTGVEAKVTRQDLNRLQGAIQDRIAELGDDGLTLKEVGSDVVNQMGFTQASEVPASKLDQALKLVAEWEPPSSSEESAA